MKSMTATIASKVDAPLIILGVGFGFSLAANMLWTWPGGPVRILGGALASLALPGAIHLWDRIPLPPPLEVPLWRGRVLRIPVMRMLRASTMTGIAAMAAFTTFSHSSALLVDHGEDPLLAALYPVMTELLVVMGVLARKAPPTAGDNAAVVARRTPRRKRRTAAPPVTVAALVESVEEPTELASRQAASGAAIDWARTAWPCTAKEIQDATGVAKGSSHRIRNKVAAERAAS